MRQGVDADAPEQAERAEPALALDEVLEAERLALLQQQLARDDLGIGAGVADDEDVVDDRLLALVNFELEVGARPIRRQPGHDDDAGGGEPAVPVFEQHRVVVGHDLRLIERRTGRRFHDRAELLLRHDGLAFERHVADERERPFRDGDDRPDQALARG